MSEVLALAVWPTAATRIAGVVGHPARHSLSPVLHNTAYGAMGLDCAYVAFDVEPAQLGDALRGMRALGLVGLSVTLPHKQAIIEHLDGLSRQAATLQAVNTVVVEDGMLTGHNTDGIGFVDSIRADLNFDPQAKRCVVLGAGGSARAVVLALAHAGAAEVVVVNRSAQRAAQAVALAPQCARIGALADVASAQLVVNATSVGMEGVAEGQSLLMAEHLHEGQTVVDLIYRPARTPLLELAASRGATVANGVGMLIHQAAAQIRLWTGRRAPLELMKEAVESGL